MKKLFLIVALLLAAAPASAQVIVKCRTSGGSLVDCSTPLNNGYVNWASPQSIGTVSAPAAIHATTFYGSAAGLTNVPASSVAGSLSGVTINCSSNTCSNIANASLLSGIDAAKIGGGTVSNTIWSYVDPTSSIQTQLNGLQPLDADLTAIAALTTTGGLARVTTNTWALRSIAAGTGITVTNGDFVSGNPTVALTNSSLTIAAGTGLSVAGCSPVGLGGTCTPSIANTAVSAASYPTSGQIPTFTVNAQGQLTAAGSTTTLTSPAISSPALSGTATGTYTLGGTPTIAGPTLSGTVAGTYTIGGTPTLGANLAAGSNKITGLATATTSGDALGYPWITATTATATGTTTTLSGSTGAWTDITGMSVSIDAGKHEVNADVRAEISESTGAGSFISCRFHDGTNPITDSETIVAQANVLNVLTQNTAPIGSIITVGSTTSIKVQCARTFSGTIITSDVPSDSNGKCRIRAKKLAP